MYRYFLFFYDDYYPLGGMEDCVLKTNNLDDMERAVNEKYESEWYQGTIAYYDAIQDKYFIAETESYENEDYFNRMRFTGWEEANLETLD